MARKTKPPPVYTEDFLPDELLAEYQASLARSPAVCHPCRKRCRAWTQEDMSKFSVSRFAAMMKRGQGPGKEQRPNCGACDNFRAALWLQDMATKREKHEATLRSKRLKYEKYDWVGDYSEEEE